jgi:hypothetical protein
MNRSPDETVGRPREAALDDRVTGSGRPPDDPELAADAALRAELRALDPVEPLPPALRSAVLARTAGAATTRSGWRGLPVALAAGLAGVLVLAAILRPSAPEPLPTDELRLALATIDRSSRDAFGRAGREVGESLRFPVIELEQLPYGHLLDSFSVSRPPSHSPEPN